MPIPLRVFGFWGLARRVASERTPSGRAYADQLGVLRAPGSPSDEWFATAERYRREDDQRYFAALARRDRLRQQRERESE
jgi:hypothetical protein